jgi:hypothetical protein
MTATPVRPRRLSMTKTRRTLNGARALAVAALTLLALCLCLTAEVRAQWAQPTPADNTISTTNNVGVGTAAPTRRLDLVNDVTGVSFEAGSGSPNSGAIRFGDNTGWRFNIGRSRNGVSGALNSGSSGLLMTVQDNGNVGLGTSSPSSRLHVVSGTSSVTALLRLDTGVAGGTTLNVGATGSDSTFDLSVNRAGQYSSRLGVSAAGDLFLQPGAGGRVGIGTTAPQAALDVAGASGVTLRTDTNSPGFSVFDRATSPGNQLVFQGNGGNFSVFNVTTKSANFGASERPAAIAMWTVDVANTANATQFQMQHSPAQGGVIFTQKFGAGAQGDRKISFQTGWNQSATPTQLVLDTNGGVGVGTPSPAGKFEVAGGSIFLGDMGQAGWGSMVVRGRILSASSNIHLSPPGGSTVYINSDYREAGGATGLVNLSVSGAITGGTIGAIYQDVAEWVPSTQKLSAGTVVVLDTERANHVLASTTSYDTKVAGVVSERPGISLGEGGEGKALVATTGRVKVKVDAARAPIHAGDLLVTSDVEGVAMKSVPVDLGGAKIHRPGTIIGKALEPLEKGTGEILVLLSLQ